MPKTIKKRTRVNVRLPEALVRWAMSYAGYSEITFTKVVELGLVKLQTSVEMVRRPRTVKHVKAASIAR
jgi:hypothetical protein